MKKVLFLACFLCVAIFPSFAFQTPLSIDVYYDGAEYEKAAQAYRELLIRNPNSAELWYNLGNSYYKSGEIGFAIASYRKAHKLNPTDEDILFNLNFVFNKTIDKVEPKPKSFIVRQTDIVADKFTSGGWAMGSIVFGILGLGTFLLYIFMKKYNIKRLGLVSSVICWGISFFCLALAAHRYYYSLESDAVVVSSSADIVAEPNENGTLLLMLNEGATLQLENKEGEWVKVELPNGTKGYVRSKSVEVI
jgi:tetratricopeptide (TPR) repeat protein